MDSTEGQRAFWPLDDLKRLKLTLPGRRRLLPPPAEQIALPAGFAGVEFCNNADVESPYAPGGAAQRQPVLVLSGGGASGAFGAGVLVGLAQANKRPEYGIVTGVSAGALIAPFAFLGSDWDKLLIEAFTGAQAAELIGMRALRPGVGGGLVAAGALVALVARFANAAMLDAVAEQHCRGRRLLVATTNLDTLRTVVWDMGAIAAQDSPARLDLFISVLAASASLPGLFAPQMIQVVADDQSFEEMHIDGGTASPLLLPPSVLPKRVPAPAEEGRIEVHAIINTCLQPIVREVPVSIVPILARSFDLMLAASYGAALRSAAELCERHDCILKITSLPMDLGRAHWMRFDQRSMARTFERGVEMGRSGDLWAHVV